MSWEGHVTHTGKKNSYKIFLEKREGKRHLERHTRRWKDHTEIDPEKLDTNVWNGSAGSATVCFKHSVGSSSFIHCGQLLIISNITNF